MVSSIQFNLNLIQVSKIICIYKKKIIIISINYEIKTTKIVFK